MKKKLYVLSIDLVVLFLVLSFFIILISINQYLIVLVMAFVLAGTVDAYMEMRVKYLYGKCR